MPRSKQQRNTTMQLQPINARSLTPAHKKQSVSLDTSTNSSSNTFRSLPIFDISSASASVSSTNTSITPKKQNAPKPKLLPTRRSTRKLLRKNKRARPDDIPTFKLMSERRSRRKRRKHNKYQSVNVSHFEHITNILNHQKVPATITEMQLITSNVTPNTMNQLHAITKHDDDIMNVTACFNTIQKKKAILRMKVPTIEETMRVDDDGDDVDSEETLEEEVDFNSFDMTDFPSITLLSAQPVDNLAINPPRFNLPEQNLNNIPQHLRVIPVIANHLAKRSTRERNRGKEEMDDDINTAQLLPLLPLPIPLSINQLQIADSKEMLAANTKSNTNGHNKCPIPLPDMTGYIAVRNQMKCELIDTNIEDDIAFDVPDVPDVLQDITSSNISDGDDGNILELIESKEAHTPTVADIGLTRNDEDTKVDEENDDMRDYIEKVKDETENVRNIRSDDIDYKNSDKSSGSSRKKVKKQKKKKKRKKSVRMRRKKKEKKNVSRPYCAICNRYFKNFQGLGGHKKIHLKTKKVIKQSKKAGEEDSDYNVESDMNQDDDIKEYEDAVNIVTNTDMEQNRSENDLQNDQKQSKSTTMIDKMPLNEDTAEVQSHIQVDDDPIGTQKKAQHMSETETNIIIWKPKYTRRCRRRKKTSDNTENVNHESFDPQLCTNIESEICTNIESEICTNIESESCTNTEQVLVITNNVPDITINLTPHEMESDNHSEDVAIDLDPIHIDNILQTEDAITNNVEINTRKKQKPPKPKILPTRRSTRKLLRNNKRSRPDDISTFKKIRRKRRKRNKYESKVPPLEPLKLKEDQDIESLVPPLSPSLPPIITQPKTHRKYKKRKKKCHKKGSKKKHKKKVRKTEMREEESINLHSRSLNYLYDGFIEASEASRVRQMQCEEFMDVDLETDELFDRILRVDKNCISNFVIKKQHINKLWLKPNEAIEIVRKYRGKYSIDWYQARPDDDSDSIALHRINLNPAYISLECPHCNVYLQCLSLSESKIAFMCYNFPRCQYPLNENDYLEKYVWDNVKYIGYTMNSKDEDTLLRNTAFTNKEVMFASFGFNKQKYRQWLRDQDRKCKKLNDRMQWKKIMRKKRLIGMNKEYYQLRNKSIN